MEVKDKRLRAISEIIRGIKVLKLYAWEKIFGNNTTKIREEELGCIRSQTTLRIAMDIMGNTSLALVRLF